MARFSHCTLGSGSRGNSLAVWDDELLFIIDAGFSGKELKRRMGQVGLDPTDIEAIIITHDHSDHSKGVGVISRRYKLPVFATPTVLDGPVIGRERLEARQVIQPLEEFAIGGFSITGFEVPHDASQTLGYRISSGEKCMAIATDTGHMTADIRKKLSNCDSLVLESNHDVEMLKTGPYPYFLKQRILSDTGHLPNDETGNTLVRVIGERTRHVTLAHLSEENNTPEAALETVKTILSKNKVKGVMVVPASQDEVGEVVKL